MSRRELSRQAQAFQSLLSPSDSEEDTSRKSRQSSSGKQSKKSEKLNSTHAPGFRLRNDPRAGPDHPHPHHLPSDDIGTLFDLFEASLPQDIIQDVLAACGGSVEAAIAALLAMSASSSEHLETNVQQPAQFPSPSIEVRPSETAEQKDNLWDMLPQECKLLIFERLSLKDLSKAASTCREFAQHIRTQRRTLRCVSVPIGLSMQAIQGIIAAFPAATAVDFSRWGKLLRFPNDFENIADAVAKGARWRAPGSSPVESINLAKCGEMTDGDLAAVCAALGSLRAVDVSRCSGLGDGMLTTLAKYRREVHNSTEESNTDDHTHSNSTNIDSYSSEARINELGQVLESTTIESPAAAVARIAEERTLASALRRTSTAPATSSGGLEEIKIVGTEVTTRGVGELLRGSTRAPSLMVLDVSRCPRVAGEALVPGPNSLLRVLRASGCPALRYITLQLPSVSQLKELVLSDCKSLRDVTIMSAPALEDLNISGCSQLISLTLRCPNLRRLRASGCSRLQLWEGGPAGGDIGGLECSNLKELNFFGCRSLESAGLEAILPSLTAVEVLDFTGCTSLSRLVVMQGVGLPELKKVLLDGCAVIRQIALEAPGLAELSAKSCPRLMVSSLNISMSIMSRVLLWV